MLRRIVLPTRNLGRLSKPTTKFSPAVHTHAAQFLKSATQVRGLCTGQNVEEPASSGGMLQRFQITAEVVVSKLFPAGFGWQYGSIVAANAGFEATDMGFFAITGLGDLTGVFLGHSIFYGIKGLVTGKGDFGTELQTGFFLGSAAFCSGAIWQPAVNFLQMTKAPFLSVALGTWAVCGLGFYGGLRLFRTVYSPFMNIEPNNYQNLKNDASLSLAIGGGTSAFVGTDVAYLDGEGNFLRPIVGIEDGVADLQGCITAGSSTALGFAVAQTAENLVWTQGKLWVD